MCKQPVSDIAFPNSQFKDFGFCFSSNYSKPSCPKANVIGSAVRLQVCQSTTSNTGPMLKANAMKDSILATCTAENPLLINWNSRTGFH